MKEYKFNKIDEIEMLSILDYGIDNNIISMGEYDHFEELNFDHQICLLKEIIITLLKERDERK